MTYDFVALSIYSSGCTTWHYSQLLNKHVMYLSCGGHELHGSSFSLSASWLKQNQESKLKRRTAAGAEKEGLKGKFHTRTPEGLGFSLHPLSR